VATTMAVDGTAGGRQGISSPLPVGLAALTPSPWSASLPDPGGYMPIGSLGPHQHGTLQQDPAWRHGPSSLASLARTAANAGSRDPYLWRSVRLRARVLAGSLSGGQVAVLLECCLRVGLVDEALLTALCGRLEALLRWSLPRVRTVIVCCNALLRLGLDPKDPLFQDLLRATALGFSRGISVFDAALLATCLARLGCHDTVLLGRAKAVLLAGVASAKQCAMLLASFARLRASRPNAIADALLCRLLEEKGGLLDAAAAAAKGEAGADDLTRVMRRTLLATIGAERRWCPASASPSELALCAAERLARLKRVAVRPADIVLVAAACHRWGGASEVVAALVPPVVVELSAWLGNRRPTWWGPLDLAFLLRSICALLPASRRGHPVPAAEQLLTHIGNQSEELSAIELVAFVEVVALAVSHGLVSGNAPHSEAERRALSLRNELYRRAHDVKLHDLPRALGALHQLLPDGDAIIIVLRRCAGRLVMDLRAALGDNTDTETLDGDCLAEILYVYGAHGHKDDGLVAACRDYLLEPRLNILGSVTRDISLVHLLHSLALAEAARGDLLHALVAATTARLERFNAFEVIGFLDAAAMLQAQAVSEGPGGAADAEMPPPSGVGEQALLAAVKRIQVLLPSLDDHELRACAGLLKSLRMPKGAAVELVIREVEKRQINLDEG